MVPRGPARGSFIGGLLIYPRPDVRDVAWKGTRQRIEGSVKVLLYSVSQFRRSSFILSTAYQKTCGTREKGNEHGCRDTRGACMTDKNGKRGKEGVEGARTTEGTVRDRVEEDNAPVDEDFDEKSPTSVTGLKIGKKIYF